MDKDGNNTRPATHVGRTANEADSRETVKSLELAIAQISMSLQESEGSVSDLIGAISVMAGCVGRIEGQLEAVETASGTSRDTILSECRQAQAAMQSAITAFQFYDRLSQRFQHVQINLRALTDVIQAPDQQHPALWQDLHKKVRSVYSLEQEQRMYKALLDSLSTEDGHKAPALITEQSSSDIELF